MEGSKHMGVGRNYGAMHVGGSLYLVCVEWGAIHVCANAQIYECERQKLTLGIFIDCSLPYKLRQGLSIVPADLASQARFGHPCLCLPGVVLISRSLCLSSIKVNVGAKLWSSCI